MLLAEKEAGIKKEVIFFHENMSIIYSECEDYEECDKKLRATDVCKRWDETVKPWIEEGGIRPAKVFDLMQQLEGGLRRD
jgi:L-rhamnose mutarotase